MTTNLESRFTPSRDWCPHPEYWHSPDSEATENEVSEFIGSLVRIIQPEFVVETGTYHGHTTYEIGLALRDNGHGKVVSLDSDRRCVEIASRRINDADEYYDSPLPIQILHMNSLDYSPTEDIDFAFFDSWQEGRIQELERFISLGRMKSGTIFAVHDTAPHHQVRKHFVPASFDSYQFIDFHTPRGLIVGQLK